MLFQKGSYLRLGQLFSLAAILIAVIIDGLLVTTKFARLRSHIIAIGFPVSLFAVGLSISEIQEAYYTEIQHRYFLNCRDSIDAALLIFLPFPNLFGRQ